MARNVNQRLQHLQARRSGLDRISRIRTADQAEVIRKSALYEGYQRRAANRPNTRYAIGTMQEVDADYTRISLDTAERVGKQLRSGLTIAGYSVEFRLQGSVPLNTHIRGVSDVDLLNLDTGFFTYYTAGVRSQAGHYQNPTSQTSIGVLMKLRAKSEEILTDAYPAATVDKSGGKAINISGGSLPRPVDVVPAHWLDTITYQGTLQEHDRGVHILNKKVPETIENLPFLHIKRVHDRDVAALGGLKKAIRLCKNVKSDAEDEGTTIALPSFDIAAIMYHANMEELTYGTIYELAILAETQRHLDWLYANKAEAEKLIVPDGSRRIFDTADKFTGLLHLSVEMDELLREVAREQSASLAMDSKPNLGQSRDAVRKVIVPA